MHHHDEPLAWALQAPAHSPEVLDTNYKRANNFLPLAHKVEVIW